MTSSATSQTLAYSYGLYHALFSIGKHTCKYRSSNYFYNTSQYRSKPFFFETCWVLLHHVSLLFPDLGMLAATMRLPWPKFTLLTHCPPHYATSQPGKNKVNKHVCTWWWLCVSVNTNQSIYSGPLLNKVSLLVFVCVCVCVCGRETGRERERELELGVGDGYRRLG